MTSASPTTGTEPDSHRGLSHRMVADGTDSSRAQTEEAR